MSTKTQHQTSNNWIKISNYSRYFIILCFAFIYILKRFELVENYELIKNVWLFDLTSFFVLLYTLLYLFESRLELKAKDQEIKYLKSQLNQ